MITDELKYGSRYALAHPLFAMAFSFLQNLKVSELGNKKIDIKGEDLYAIPLNQGNSTSNNPKLEMHRQYIDIHYVISGKETYGWKPGENCSCPEGDFNFKDDYIFFTDPCYQRIILNENNFIIFYPGEAHIPCVETIELQKIILKVKAT